jgi:hypothetical protein
MNFLLPEGKELNQIFEQTVRTAWERGGGDHNAISLLCAALIALPRPVPMGELVQAIDLDQEETRDLCGDLFPTLRVDDQLVSFADEDFEDYVAQRGASELARIRTKIAQQMLRNAGSDPYAARHVVSLLIEAGMENEALVEAMKEPNDKLFPDPVMRRLCHLERMRGALKVCSRTGNGSESLTILLVGAEALRTSDAMADMLARNADLATKFARDAVDRLVLSNVKYFAAHGPVLCHYMVEDAKAQLFSRVAYSKKMFFGWQDTNKEVSGYREHSQDFSFDDTAAYCYTVLVIDGTDSLLKTLNRLKENRYPTFMALIERLLNQRDIKLLEDLLSFHRLQAIERIQVLSMLIRLGADIDPTIPETLLARLISEGVFDIVKSKNGAKHTALRECALEICEYLVHSGHSTVVVQQLLTKWSAAAFPRGTSTSGYKVPPEKLWLKFECLLAELEGRPIEAYEFFGLEAPPTRDWNVESGISREENTRRFESYSHLAAVLPFYLSRAQYIRTGNLDIFLGSGRSAWTSKIRTDINRRSTGRSVEFSLLSAAASVVSIGRGNISKHFQLIRELIESEGFPFNAEDVSTLLFPFTWRSEGHGPLTEYANQWLPKIAAAKISSSTKAKSYLAVSRLLVNVSLETSASFFSKAFMVLEEIDYHEMSLLGIFDRLTSVVANTISAEESRAAAISLASFGTDVAIRLEGYDHFPWANLSRAIGRLNAPIALAIASRWEDDDMGVDTETLQVILHEGVKNGDIPVGYAASARYLSERTYDKLVPEIISASKYADEKTRYAVREMLAECEALLNHTVPQPETDTAIVDMHSAVPLGRWTRYLKERIEFLRELPSPVEDETSHSDYGPQSEIRRVEFLKSLDWQNASFQSAEEISVFVGEVRATARKGQSHFYDDKELYRLIRKRILAHHQTELLKHLSDSILKDDSNYLLAEVLANSVEDWLVNSIMVQDWCRINIPVLLSSRLIMFTRSLYDTAPLAKLIDTKCITAEKFYEAVLLGIPEYIEKFDARMTYDIIQIVAGLVPPSEANRALTSYLDRLFVRTAPEDRLNPEDLPVDIAEAQARLLYANLGDVSLAIRWRAAHAVRALFELECAEVIDHLIQRYARRDELSFRSKNAPFYWVAARLWLTIAISRACVDNPAFASRYANFLLSILSDADFPHLLAMSFAKQGLEVLAFTGAVKLTPAQKTLVRTACTSPLPKQKRPKDLDSGGDRAESTSEGRRFHFDSMDTLRYWYPNRAEIFADVSLTKFVDEAERWIVDEWGVAGNPWRWLDEPRRRKFERYERLTSHSHGSLPRAERFSTHLEWHAMWCAIGSLMAKHPLNKGEWGDDRLQEEFKSSTVVASPHTWLSDLRSPKPLEPQFWVAPKKESQWVSEPSPAEILSILGLDKPSPWFLASSQYTCYWEKYHQSIGVTSCLVSPQTSSALLRALQFSNETHGHYLPSGDGEGINTPPFVLEKWLAQAPGREGLDEKDDFGESLAASVSRPDDLVIALCGLIPSTDYNFGWQVASTSELAFYSEQWTERIPENRYYDDWKWVRSTGERLQCERTILEDVLRQKQRNLLIKIHTYRKKDEDQFDESEDAKSEYFNTYVLLTQEGVIETATGPVGTWKTPS